MGTFRRDDLRPDRFRRTEPVHEIRNSTAALVADHRHAVSSGLGSRFRSLGFADMPGWVYVFANAVVPNHVKVGFTERDPEIRAKELAATGLPGEYTVEFAIEVGDPRHIEREAHRLLGDAHYHKEWFECTIAHARRAIEAAIRDSSLEGSGSPLVPGHALEHFYDHASNSGARDLAQQRRPVFTLENRSTTCASSSRPLFGEMVYTCKFCDRVSNVPANHVVRCPHCGKNDVVS